MIPDHPALTRLSELAAKLPGGRHHTIDDAEAVRDWVEEYHRVENIIDLLSPRRRGRRGPPQRGFRLIGRLLGLGDKAVARALRVAALPDDVKAALRGRGLDSNMKLALTVADLHQTERLAFIAGLQPWDVERGKRLPFSPRAARRSDGVYRMYTFKMYPTKQQAEELEARAKMHCALYNALIQIRDDQYRRNGRTPTLFDQLNDFTTLRNDPECLEWREFSRREAEFTVGRVDRGFASFFGRLAAGKFARPPRQKDERKCRILGVMGRSSSWNFMPHACKARGKLRVKGVAGLINVRGRMPAGGDIRRQSAAFRDGCWRLCVEALMPPRRSAGTETVRVTIDADAQMVRIATQNGSCPASAPDTRDANPSDTARGDSDPAPIPFRELDLAQRVYRRKAGTLKERSAAARRRRDAYHRITSSVIAHARAIDLHAPARGTLDLKSGKGSTTDPGALVSTVAAVNRRMSSQAIGSLIRMIEYKAMEAGTEITRHTTEIAQTEMVHDAVKTAKLIRKTRRIVNVHSR